MGDGAIDQSASASGVDALASNTIDNLGTIEVTAIANATAENGDASATASVSTGFTQFADGDAGADAANTITNAGTLTISAEANARVTGVGVTGSATASATVSDAFFQQASASGGGNATNTVANAATGVINITAVANALSTTSSASATANITNAIEQSAFATGVGNALSTVTNAGTININATGTATGSYASGGASLNDVINQSASATGGDATASLTNSGTLNITAVANANSTRISATATASAHGMISQNATASGADNVATASITNSGTMNLTLDAVANANTSASVSAHGHSWVFQTADGNAGADAVASFTNSGTINAEANATANGNSGEAWASLSGFLEQSANATGGGDASALVVNSGTLNIIANGTVNADVNFATVTMTSQTGIIQSASATGAGAALASINNSGTINIVGNGVANGVTFASASVTVTEGISQNATATGEATAVLTNSGTLNIAANADAVAAATAVPGIATAFAMVETGIFQSVSGATALASVDNAAAGVIDIAAVANASAVSTANATASVFGVIQQANGGTISFTNSGSFSAAAEANAVSPALANAGAWATGVEHFVSGGTAVFANNDGATFSVSAIANADGASGTAEADAYGLWVHDTVDMTLDVTNGGEMNVTASAVAASTADATAVGIWASAVGTALAPLAISGAIDNSGTLNVRAVASGTADSALATGIFMDTGVNTTVVTNSGALNVDAVTSGGPAIANGVNVIATNPGVPAVGDVFTFVNDGGDIVVRQSVDSGATWTRGMALNLAGSPNPSVVNLLGDGSIYGNIDINPTDEINVEAGDTYFDGIINPEFLPVGGVVPATLDSGLFGEGTLNIQAGGNLILADPRITGDPDMYDGPAYAFVETFNVAADGTITFELQPAAAGDQPPGTYPQVFTDVANLDGTLVAAITPPGGLFEDEYFWDNVIDANTRNGGFDGARCVIDGIAPGSLFLSLDCIEDADDNIDLAFERTAFDAIPGLTDNAQSVSEGLECIFDPSLTGGIADLLSDLFLITDVADYQDALDQLSGRATPSTCSRSSRWASTITTCSTRRLRAKCRPWRVR